MWVIWARGSFSGTGSCTASRSRCEPTFVCGGRTFSFRSSVKPFCLPSDEDVTRVAPMKWPSLLDYLEAIQAPAHYFRDASLRVARFRSKRDGTPAYATGNFAIVFEAEVEGRRTAVRCLTRAPNDLLPRYEAISEHVSRRRERCSFLSDVRVVHRAIRIGGTELPVLLMPWVDGVTLDEAVRSRLHDRIAMRSLSESFRALWASLFAEDFGHGDLQHGNILWDGNQLRVVDYDGAWVPSLTGRGPCEAGHPNYQHPKRVSTPHLWGVDVDAFSGLLIYLSLRALEFAPQLFERFHNGENLIFTRDDFHLPGRSACWNALAALNQPDIDRLSNLLRESLIAEPTRGSLLSSHVRGSPPTETKKRAGTAAGIPWGPMTCTVPGWRAAFAPGTGAATADSSAAPEPGESGVRQGGLELVAPPGWDHRETLELWFLTGGRERTLPRRRP